MLNGYGTSTNREFPEQVLLCLFIKRTCSSQRGELRTSSWLQRCTTYHILYFIYYILYNCSVVVHVHSNSLLQHEPQTVGCSIAITITMTIFITTITSIIDIIINRQLWQAEKKNEFKTHQDTVVELCSIFSKEPTDA